MVRMHKGLLITLIIFAVIGLVALVGLGTWGTYKLVDRLGSTAPEAAVSIIEGADNKNYQEPDVNADVIAEVESKVDESTTSVEVPGETAEDTVNTSEEVIHDDGKLSIVFFGDSILDNFRDETGICYLVGEALDANVYNLAVAGMAASSQPGEDPNVLSESGQGADAGGYMLTEMLLGVRDFAFLRDCSAKSIMQNNLEQIKNADIFVVEYGINDFMRGRRTTSDSDTDIYNVTTYCGAMRIVVNNLKKLNPNAKIVLCQLSYYEFYRANGEYIGNTYNMNNGPGTGYQYSEKLDYIEGLYDDGSVVQFHLEEQGIDEYNVNDVTLDHLHFNEEGRAIYAENLVKTIKEKVLNR